MQTSEWHAARTSFGPAAELYDRIRPTYPAEAIDWMLGPAPVRVVDLGAGTGILTRQLHAAGHQVVAVEPDDGMRARLCERLPDVEASAGSAEQIPLPDGSVDAVVAGQAYHWFDTEVAHPEIARVLRPGGVFAPIWNHRDEDEGWVAELSEIIDDGEDPEPLLPADLFGSTEVAHFRHEKQLTPEALVDLVRSRSAYLTATPSRRAELESAVRRLCATEPGLRGRDEFAMPYRTTAYRAPRLG